MAYNKVNLRTLKNRKQYLRVAKGRRVGKKGFSLQMIRNDYLNASMEGKIIPAGIGITVTKKIGSSPERNRIKRRLREIVRKNAKYFEQGCDYVLIGKRAALSQPFDELLGDLKYSIIKIHKNHKNKKPNTN